MKKVLIALALLTVSACAATPPNPPAPPPTKAGFPDDTQLICYAGQWAIVSPSLELAGVFDIPCCPNV